jgi:hypothetical protein
MRKHQLELFAQKTDPEGAPPPEDLRTAIQHFREFGKT